MSGALVGLVLSSTVAFTSSISAKLGPVPFDISAEKMSADLERGVYLAEGEVELVREGVVLRADRVRFERETERAIADGNVTVVDDKSVLLCTHVEMKIPELTGGLSGARLFIKTGIPEELKRTMSGEALAHSGKNQLIVGAESIERTDARRFHLNGGTITTCDCTEGQTATWSISASSASVDLDSGATLVLPVFYAKGVPFFVLPAFYVPLGPRRTGLLLPRLQTSAVTTVSVYEPLFLALGDSYDATLEPGFLLSRGPSGVVEGRWAPTASTHGALRTTVTLDYGTPVANGRYERTRDDAIARYAITGRHETRWSAGAVVAEIDLLGDPAYSEFADRYLTRRAEYSQSRITVSARAANAVRVSGGLAFLEDLRPQTYAATGGELREVGVLSARNAAADVRYRIAELRLDAPPSPLLSAESFAFGDARLKIDAYGAPDSQVARFVRADLRPQIAAPIHLGGIAVLEPSVVLRLSGWAGRADGDDHTASRVAGIGGVRLSTELRRAFDDFVHSIRPELAYVIVPFVEGSGEQVFSTLDEIDRLVRVQQLVARIATDVHAVRDGHRIAGLDVRAGRDLRYGGHPAAWSELIARGDVTLSTSPVRVSADASITAGLERVRLHELIAGITVTSARGDALGVHYGEFGTDMPEQSLAAFEELVPTAFHTLPVDRWDPFRGLNLSARTGVDLWEGWGRVSFGFDADLVFEDDPPPANTIYGWEHLRDTRTTLFWASSCGCFGIGATVATDRSRPGVELAEVKIDLGSLGAVRP